LALALMLGSGPMVVETAPGTTQQIAIGRGVTAYLNGSTRIEYSGKDGREIALIQGEALFDVEHGTGRPLEVTAGDLVMRDLGTTFNVVHSPTVTQLSVSQGKVIFDSKGVAIPVVKGQAVRKEAGQAVPQRFDIPSDSVAGWKSGRLVYRNASINQIAEDFSRRLGQPITVAQSAVGKRYTGTLTVGSKAESAIGDLQVMIGVSARRSKAGWILDAADGPAN
jgi:transmembrane sensor